MGGIGSGRGGGRPLVEDSYIIDIARIRREGRMRDGEKGTFHLSWSNGGVLGLLVLFDYDLRDLDVAFLRISYFLPWAEVEWLQTQHIHLVHTAPPYGGRRWWMLCPSSLERVGKLYLPQGYPRFAGRKTLDLGYRLQRLQDHQKNFFRLHALQRRLGCLEDWELSISRPRGMWQRTWEPLRREFIRLERECSRYVDDIHALADD